MLFEAMDLYKTFDLMSNRMGKFPFRE